MTDNIIKTEIKLSEKSVSEIVTAETAKALLAIPDFMEKLIKTVLFTRPRKRNSYDPEPNTFFETGIQAALKPVIKEEIENIANKHRKSLSGIISKAFKSKIIDNKEFETKLIEQLSKFTSNIKFYVSD